jgi:putative glycerol-1-phosphate prenyltransferase
MSQKDKLIEARAAGDKLFGVLVDPDRPQGDVLIAQCMQHQVDWILVGGSLLNGGSPHRTIQFIRSRCSLPIVIFPGGIQQVDPAADAFLLLSLISGRNPELLIGKHVEAAPLLRQSGLEIISTGYMLIDGGRPTTAAYVSHTLPIPADKPELAATTALAGEMLGLRTIFLDAGSGAESPVSAEMIAAVRAQVQVPLIVGGGISQPDQAYEAARAGADLIVVGTAFESDPTRLQEMVEATRAASGRSTVTSRQV